LTATPLDASGNPLTGRTVTWSSSNAALAIVNNSGLVTGLAAGSVTITATSEGQGGSSSITVSQIPVASVTVTPNSTSVDEGNAVQLTAVLEDASGNQLFGRAVQWGTSDAGTATVNGSGLVSGVSVGTVTITATSGSQSGTATVSVTRAAVDVVEVSPGSATMSPSGTLMLSAVTKDAAGNVLTGRAISWTSNSTGVATVTASGLVTAIANGSATITATSEGQTGTSVITVISGGGLTPNIYEHGFEDGTSGLFHDNKNRPFIPNSRWVLETNDAARGNNAVRWDIPVSGGNVGDHFFFSYADTGGPAAYSHIFVRMACKFSAGFNFADNIKILRPTHTKYGAKSFSLVSNAGGNSFVINPGSSQPSQPITSVGPTESGAPSPRSLAGQWFWVELEVETRSASNATIRVWINDQLTHNITRTDWTAPATTFQQIHMPLWANSMPTASSFSCDEIGLSTQRMGIP
jgi:uncharacterized protein YjdB